MLTTTDLDDFLDGVAGLRAIEWCSAALAASGKQLVLYHPPAMVTRLIAVTGMAAGVTIR